MRSPEPSSLRTSQTSSPGRCFERLTEPPDLVEGDEACSEAGESLVAVFASLVTDGQAAEAVEPGVGALHHPVVTPEPLATLDASAGDARHDSASPAFQPPRPDIVGIVSVQLTGPLARSLAPSATQRRDGIKRRGLASTRTHTLSSQAQFMSLDLRTAWVSYLIRVAAQCCNLDYLPTGDQVKKTFICMHLHNLQRQTWY